MKQGLQWSGCLAVVCCMVCVPARADADGKGPAVLELPAKAFERNGKVAARLRFDHAHTGKGQLHVRWTDSLGRVVQDDSGPAELTDENQLGFTVDMTRAVAMRNTLEATYTLEEATATGTSHVEESAKADFIAKPAVNGWRDYEIIMYQAYPATIQTQLQSLGINGGQWVGRNLATPDFLLDSNLRWYSENIATDFYSEYHRYRLDRKEEWSFIHTKDVYFKDPTSKEALKRHPSFSDPVWLQKIHDRLHEVVTRNSPYQPIFYSLADESGIADLGAQWDFDFSDQSLQAMRVWLQGRYSTLAALNAAWGTHFTEWNLVTPDTTNEAMKRKDENWTSWAEFKEWMDIAYASAIRMGVDAVHEVDPAAYAGIVGAQKPGWGGYDYARLATAASVMEPYDIGGNVKLVHSLNPAMPLLSTTFASDDWERHRIWHELFQGNRGLILWDDTQRYIHPDGSKADAGLKAEDYYNELRNGLAATVIASKSEDDGIAIHYSQPSLRTQWMLERRPDGDAWMTRLAEYERSHNDFLRLRESWTHAMEDQGLQYRYLSYLQMEQGDLLRSGCRVLLLPNSNSLSAKEAAEIRTFVQRGGTVIADGTPGIYDEHSRHLPASPLADLFPVGNTESFHVTVYGAGKAIAVHANLLPYLQDRLSGKERVTAQMVAAIFKQAGVIPRIRVTDAKGLPVVGVNVRSFTNGSVQLLTLLSNPQLLVDELGTAEVHTNERFSKPQHLVVRFPTPVYVRDIRTKRDLGRVTNLPVTMDGYDPTVLAISSVPQPSMQTSLPAAVKAGERLTLAIDASGAPASTAVYHVDVVDPAGKRNLQYSTNVFGENGTAVHTWPLAKNDPAGAWTFHVHDLLTGVEKTQTVQVQAATE
ncbi:MAG: beta-galactosidase [Janthinobacterium lividum]